MSRALSVGAQDPSLFHGIPREGGVVSEKENELGSGLGSLLPINLWPWASLWASLRPFSYLQKGYLGHTVMKYIRCPADTTKSSGPSSVCLRSCEIPRGSLHRTRQTKPTQDKEKFTKGFKIPASQFLNASLQGLWSHTEWPSHMGIGVPVFHWELLDWTPCFFGVTVAMFPRIKFATHLTLQCWFHFCHIYILTNAIQNPIQNLVKITSCILSNSNRELSGFSFLVETQVLCRFAHVAFLSKKSCKRSGSLFQTQFVCFLRNTFKFITGGFFSKICKAVKVRLTLCAM